MKEFTYVITDEVGLHARPAAIVAKEVKKYASKILLFKGEKSCEPRKLMALMGLGVKCGDEVRVVIEGEDEEQACAELEAFFKANV